MTCRKDLASELVALQGMDGLERASGKQFWRSLDELSNTKAFQQLIEREFPNQASVWPDALSRRKFLTLMGASLALAGVGGCSVRPAPSTDIVPYVRQPEEIVPGKPLFYATAMTLGGSAVGLLVESHMGRPTKIEGNPDHPASLGASGIYEQASVLALYDPDRSQTVMHLGQERTWEDATAAISAGMKKQRDAQGAGLRILTEAVVSPTLAAQLADLLDALPKAKWCVYEPLHQDAARRGAALAFGDENVVDMVYDFTKADVVLSLDADFLTTGAGHLRYAADFMARRQTGDSGMNRLYAVETAVSCTGAKADHRLALQGRAIERLARALAAKLGLPIAPSTRKSSALDEAWIAAVADDLAAHRGRSLVIAGARQPAAVHLLAHAINDHLGNFGETVNAIAPVDAWPEARVASIGDLIDDMEAGDVDFVLVLDANPVLTAPVDLGFTEAFQKVPLRVHLGLYQDETARQCHWHLPQTHYLEAWSDARAFDGTASIVQPLIEPLYQGRSAHEVLALLAAALDRPGREIVREHWRRAWHDGEPTREQPFESLWQTALHDGVIPGTRQETKQISLVSGWEAHFKKHEARASEQNGQDESSDPTATVENNEEKPPAKGLELVFLPDPTLYDGRFANNGWLQELPKPMTQLAWGNAALMSPKTAESLGVKQGSYAHGGEHGGYHMPVVELELYGRVVRAPAWIVPGQADDTVAVYLGNGRERAGRVGGSGEERIGFDAYALRTSGDPWFASGLKVSLTADTALVACTQAHHSMEGREPVRVTTLADYQKTPDFIARQQAAERRDLSPGSEEPLTLYPSFNYDAPKHKWGMSIDLGKCIGCNACIVACQAENNIPVVGKEQVARGREMHWLRVDRYVEGPADAPDGFHFQPVPCMHCENAPCEYVCPVAATVHSSEGLNDMIYNRCVGTRFCSNNCPYKVRRFNFLAYADFKTETLRLQYNPDVTVRSRGVMEKCTYCVQRIRQAEIGSETEGRAIIDGEVLTACQAACPTQAIVFGDMNDPQSKVKQSKESPLGYSLLEEANTLPRTTYLAAVRNPNPKLETG